MNTSSTLKSSIVKKVFMSLTGFFLLVFLLVHLGINLLLLVGDGELFNEASHFMGTNPVIYVFQYVLAAGFILHIIYAIILSHGNYIARPVKYQKNNPAANSSWSSRNMIVTGVLTLFFLVLHLKDLFYVMKFGDMEDITHYELVVSVFEVWYYVAVYVVAFVLLGVHLKHGFQSAFLSIGFNHPTYTPILKMLGTAYSVLVPAAFAVIPIYFFIMKLLADKL